MPLLTSALRWPGAAGAPLGRRPAPPPAGRAPAAPRRDCTAHRRRPGRAPPPGRSSRAPARRRRPASAACRARCSRPDGPWRRGRGCRRRSPRAAVPPGRAWPPARSPRRPRLGRRRIAPGFTAAPSAPASAPSAAAISAKTPGPVAWPALAEQPHGRIPGRIGARRSSSASRAGRASATQTGRPSAPARCAGAESDTIIRSRLAITAAISRKPSGIVDEFLAERLHRHARPAASASWSRPTAPAR